MVPVCDKRYHIYNRFRHFWAEIKKLWNYPLSLNYTYLLAMFSPILVANILTLPRNESFDSLNNFALSIPVQ